MITQPYLKELNWAHPGYDSCNVELVKYDNKQLLQVGTGGL